MSERLVDAARLLVPIIEAKPWPSLGGHVVRFIEENLVHGPGDVRGHPVELTEEQRSYIWRAYEVYPRGHELAGRRRFKRATYSRRKGTAKTELLALLAIAELDPSSPVRCIGWRKAHSDDVGEGYSPGEWVPIGGPVRDPYIPLVATTEEQSDDLAFGVARAILEECELGNSYDVGIERIAHRSEPGVMKSLASAPSARDGALTTFEGFDETHLFLSPRLKGTHSTMLRNLSKRFRADPWAMEATTMYEPGAGSIAQSAHEYALDIAEGRIHDAAFLFDHRQAALLHDLSRRRELIRAIEEASGDALEFADVPAIANEYLDPTKDRQEFRRYWLNQRAKSSARWIAPEVVEGIIAPRRRARKGARVVLAFDGSYNRDSTALVGCTIAEKPHVWVEAAWEKPRSMPAGSWRVEREDVISAIEHAMNFYDVVEFAPDPPGWHHEIEALELTYGETVVRFETSQPSRIGPAAEAFVADAKEERFTIDGREELVRHLGNAVTKDRRGYKVPVKSSDDSPDKIDLAIGAVIAYSRAVYHVMNPPARRLSWKAV